MTWVETGSGRKIDFLHPDPEQIVIGDIARALSRIPRFNGHTKGCYPYSVAQHSTWCADVAGTILCAPKGAQLHVLLHDVHEAYMGDIVRPLQKLGWIGTSISATQRKLQAAIHQALGVGTPNRETVNLITHVDGLALAAEAYALMPSRGAEWDLPADLPAWVTYSVNEVWPPAKAEMEFLAEFEKLTK